MVPDKFAALAGSASKVAVVFDAMVAASVSDYGKVAEVFALTSRQALPAGERGDGAADPGDV